MRVFSRRAVVSAVVALLLVCCVRIPQGPSVVTVSLDEGPRPKLDHTGQSEKTEQSFLLPDPELLAAKYNHRLEINVERDNCSQVSYAPVPLPITALASVPGSGNTWARHLIELITGVYTGAIYHDPTLLRDFPGEGRVNSSVIVFKTHVDADRIDKKPTVVWPQRLVLVIRHPLDASQAEFQRQSLKSQRRHMTEHVDESAWNSFFFRRPQTWADFHRNYLIYARDNHADVFLLFYDDLKKNLTRALTNLAHFLGVKLSSEILNCTLTQSEGGYHRRHNKTIDIFENVDTQPAAIDKALVGVNSFIEYCLRDGLCVTSGSTKIH